MPTHSALHLHTIGAPRDARLPGAPGATRETHTCRSRLRNAQPGTTAQPVAGRCSCVCWNSAPRCTLRAMRRLLPDTAAVWLLLWHASPTHLPRWLPAPVHSWVAPCARHSVVRRPSQPLIPSPPLPLAGVLVDLPAGSFPSPGLHPNHASLPPAVQGRLTMQ